MVVSAMNGPIGETRTSAATFTIRFPQIDAAGLVFYPRYFEIVGQCFPHLPLAEPPFDVETQFVRPIKLGARLDLEALVTTSAWTVTASDGSDVCFTMHATRVSPEATHNLSVPHAAFESESKLVGDWCVGKDEVMLLSRSFELVNVAIEEWFEESLGMPFHELHVGRKTGIPTARFRTSVRKMPTAGSKVTVRIRPTKIGNSSMSFTSWIASENEWLIRNEQVIVFVRMLDGGYELMQIPVDIRQQFARQTEACN